MLSFKKVGIYVDVENINRNGGFGMQYDVLRKFVCRDGAEPMRLNAYVGFDKQRSLFDEKYRDKTRNFFSRIRGIGFKLVEKEVKWYQDENGNKFGKANADLDMAVDALLQSENLDRVVMVTGDGDFTQVVRALQNKGCRVEVVAFDNVSSDLRKETDIFISGYLIPNLLPIRESNPWGTIGSRVRGICYYYRQEEGFGYLRFLGQFGPLWITDPREENSPYKTAYFNAEYLMSSPNILNGLPSRSHIFEFTLLKSERYEGQFQAEDIVLVSKL